MRLLKIGRDNACDIVLHSNHVSSLHAELVLLDNGDMELEDKGSKNGTFIMNQPIAPGKAIKVNRGDAIRFGDTELQWSQVPMPEDNSAYKALWGIGTNLKNDLQLSGATVSRYHATVKLGRDGKMYIVDHSKNGTTVNGQKITSHNPYRIRRKDAIVCGGVPVDTSGLPWPTDVLSTILKVAAIVIIVCGVGFGVYKIIDHTKPDRAYTDAELYAMYNNAVVWIYTEWHYEVTIGDMTEEEMGVFGLPKEFIIDSDGDLSTGKVASQGTGFFVSNDGKIVTNLHVVHPWVDGDVIDYCKMTFTKYYTRKLANYKEIFGNVNLAQYDAYISMIEIKGVVDAIFCIPQGKYFSSANALQCRILSTTSDVEKDLALIQSDRGEIPALSRYINVEDSMNVNEETLVVGAHVYTLGFPNGIIDGQTQKLESVKGLQVVANGGSITQSEREYEFQYNAPTAGGASGSPVFDEHGMLIGVHHAGLSDVSTQGFNFGIKAKYVKELLDSPYKK